jgi:hypothetical protein
VTTTRRLTSLQLPERSSLASMQARNTTRFAPSTASADCDWDVLRPTSQWLALPPRRQEALRVTKKGYGCLVSSVQDAMREAADCER